MKSVESVNNRISLMREPFNLKIANNESSGEPSFSTRLNAAVKDVNSKQNTADDSIEKVIKGELGIHEGMLAIGRADTSLKLLVQVRSKVMEAYKTIINMQI